jgi:uncharacterized protein
MIAGCELGSALSRFDLGSFYNEGRGVQRDTKRAESLVRRACDAQDGSGCCELGNYYRTGTVVEQNVDEAFRLYSLACDLNDPLGCGNLGVMSDTGASDKTPNVHALSIRRLANSA